MRVTELSDLRGGDELVLTRSASVQFVQPVPFRLIRVLPYATYVIWTLKIKILRQYPNGEPHLSCISPAASEGVIEAVDYPPHPYERSSTFPEDATKALCGYCKGTHGTVAQITLEPGMARNVDSTKFR